MLLLSDSSRIVNIGPYICRHIL